MTVAFTARVAFQVVYFVIIARSLGVSGFGALAAAIAMVSLLVPFASWGSGNMLVMDVAREPRAFPVAFGNALVALCVSGTLLLAIALGIGVVVLPQVPLAAILLLGVADLGFARLVDIAGQSFQAFDRIAVTAWISVLVSGFRCLLTVVFAAAWPPSGVVGWAGLYLGSTVIGAAIALTAVLRNLGRPKPSLTSVRDRIRLGGYFAVAASATTIYSDIDKVMLARLSTLDATGIYAAAHRAAGLAFMPVMALLTAAYPRFFRAGAHGISGSTAYARRLLKPAAAYGVVVGIAIYFLAPLAPTILGDEYEASVDALRWLAPLPLLAAFCYLPADALTGANAQGLRTLLQVGAAMFNVAINAFLIPAYSWRGAAWATLATLAVLSLSLWLATARLQRTSEISTVSPLGDTG